MVDERMERSSYQFAISLRDRGDAPAALARRVGKAESAPNRLKRREGVNPVSEPISGRAHEERPEALKDPHDVEDVGRDESRRLSTEGAGQEGRNLAPCLTGREGPPK